MKLKFKERLALIYQLRILEKLYPDEKYELFTEALVNGYTYQYDWFNKDISRDEIPLEKCKEVFDILDVYDFILYSYERLEDKTGIDEESLRFLGFDGNYEAELSLYTEYVIKRLDRFSRVNNFCTEDFISHCPMLDTYKKMLVKYKNIKPIYSPIPLTKEDILNILSR